MRIVLTSLLLGCVAPRRPCFTTLDLTVFGSQSDGASQGPPFDDGSRDRWGNNDVTVGGSATLTFDFTGSCEWEGE